MTDYPSWLLPPIWSPEGNIVKNVWEDKRQIGQACLWSCAWLGGPVKMGYAVENLTPGEVWAELRDQATRGSTAASAVVMDLSPDPNDACWAGGKMPGLDVIREGRQHYIEYSCLWSLGKRAMTLRFRPGWGPPFTLESFKHHRDGCWYFYPPEGDPIRISDEYIPPRISAVQERAAAEAVNRAISEKMIRSMKRR